MYQLSKDLHVGTAYSESIQLVGAGPEDENGTPAWQMPRPNFIPVHGDRSRRDRTAICEKYHRRYPCYTLTAFAFSSHSLWCRGDVRRLASARSGLPSSGEGARTN